MNENGDWLATLAKEVVESFAKKIRLLSLREGEDPKSVMVFRMHPVVIASKVALIFSGTLFLAIVWILLVVVFELLRPYSVIYVLLSAAVLVSFLVFVWQFVGAALEWWSTVYIVTDKRIVVQSGIVKQRIREAMLTSIQDISYQRMGFFDTMLGRGDVTIETASISSRIVFRAVRNAPQVRDRVSERLRPIQLQLQRQQIETELRKQLGL